jgi:hypothetical protein
MTTLFVRHTVSDYPVWRKAYESVAAMQKAHGVTAEAVYQAIDNPNDVTVTHDFATPAQAKAFAESPDLQEAMKRAGVVGSPSIWFATKA